MFRKLALAVALLFTLGVAPAFAATGSMTGPIAVSPPGPPIVHIKCSRPGGPRDVTLCLAASGPYHPRHPRPVRYFLSH